MQKDWLQSLQKAKEIKRKIKEIKQQNQLAAANSVATAKDINDMEYEQLLTKHSLSNPERYQVDKYILKQRYGIVVTPELKLQDEKGYYGQLLIHYYLTHESEYFHVKDQQEWSQQLLWGEGQVFLPDLRTYTLKVEAMRALGVMQFLELERVFSENDADLIWLKNVARQSSKHIKRALGIDLFAGKKPVSGMKVLSRLLGLLGLKLQEVNDSYKIDLETLNDGRDKIFAVWQNRDDLILNSLHYMEYEITDIPKKCQHEAVLTS